MSFSARSRRACALTPLLVGVFAFDGTLVRAEPSRLAVSGSVEVGEPVAAEDAPSLVSVPEPGILVSLFGGMGVLLGLQRFRRRG